LSCICVALATWQSKQRPGLEIIETHKWGGLMLTIVAATVGIVASFPMGVLLALGRQSKV
jgi:general L-amino acid transport system permease protein